MKIIFFEIRLQILTIWKFDIATILQCMCYEIYEFKPAMIMAKKIMVLSKSTMCCIMSRYLQEISVLYKPFGNIPILGSLSKLQINSFIKPAYMLI